MKLITAFFMSWGCFCAIPCPVRKWDDAARPLMIVCLPVLGVFLGGLWALCGLVTCRLPEMGAFGAALLAVLPALLSGFIHTDGFMDCCDAIFSRRDLKERQRILKDSHVGAFAVLGVVVLFLLQFSLFLTVKLDGKLWAMVFLPAVTRACSAAAVDLIPPMESSSYAGTYRERVRRNHAAAIILIGLGCMAASVLLSGRAGLSAAAAALGSVAGLRYGIRQLGGMSGDVSGFAIHVGEFFGVLALTFL